MSKKYHISPKTGRSGVCDPKATGICQFTEAGVEPPHYATKADADAEITRTLEAEHGNINPITKQVFSKSYLKKREGKRNDAEIIEHLKKFTENQLQAQENGKPLSVFAQEREIKRENGVITFKNGLTGKYTKYKKDYVVNYNNYSLKLNRFAVASESDNPTETREAATQLLSAAAKLGEKESSLLNEVSKDPIMFNHYVSIVAMTNSDYINGYPVGSTQILMDLESGRMTHDFPTNDVREIRELHKNNKELVPIVEDIKSSSSLEALTENSAIYDDLVKGEQSKNLAKKISSETLREYINSKEEQLKSLKLAHLKAMKNQETQKVKRFSSKAVKQETARKIAELDEMIANV